MTDRVRRLRRTARVVRTGVVMFAGYRRTRRLVRGLPQEQADAIWASRHEDFADTLYRLATDLRGMYIKTGQFIGTRTDLFPEPYVQRLAQLQDRVPPHPFPVVAGVIESTLHRPVRDLFAHFEREPVASASLAQVHRAVLHDGRSVAVKVQYPEVAGLIRLDTRNLQTLIRLVARLEPNFDFRSVAKELAEQVPLELDFEREARLTELIRREMANVPGVVVPETVPSLVSSRVLTTRFLEGCRLFERGQAAAGSQEERERIARTIASAYGHQILIRGVFQADPHPGNLLLLPDGRVGLLDFGLTKELPDRIRIGFARLVVAAADRDFARVAEALAGVGVAIRSDSPEDVLSLVQLFFDARPEGSGAARPGARRQALRRSPVEAIPGDLVLLGRVVGLLRGVNASLGVPFSPMAMLRPFAERAVEEFETGSRPKS